METTTLIFPSSNKEVEYSKTEVIAALEYLGIEEFTGANGDKPTYQEMPHGIFISTTGKGLNNRALENEILVHIENACTVFFDECECGGCDENFQPCDNIYCEEESLEELAEKLGKVLEAVAAQEDSEEEEDCNCGREDCYPMDEGFTEDEDELDSLAFTGEYGRYLPEEGIALYGFIEELDYTEFFIKDEYYDNKAKDLSWCKPAYALINEFINTRLPEGFWVNDSFIVNAVIPQGGRIWNRYEVKMLLVSAIWAAKFLDNADYFVGLRIDAHFKNAQTS